MTNKMQEKLTNFRVYLDGDDLLGTADVQLPDLEAMTDTVKGAGIAGEVEVPILGHYGSMGLTINWRTVNGNTMTLAKPMVHKIELRGSVQVFDAGDGKYSIVGQKVVVQAVPKKTGLGKLDVGAGQDTSSEFEINYIKIFLDGKEVLEIDKYNYICKIDGEDFLAETRKALGL
ncbi:MAG: phage major tail tube protein [Desulfobacterales bacterium]|nr:phage major tail tube protein [Desulfobacterales bacterium]